jgi:hypothetical protein
MTIATHAATPIPYELDEQGNVPRFTPEQCLAVLTEWAANYPSARFVVVAMAPDGSDAEVLGWGLALPDRVFAELPARNMTFQFSTADNLLWMLGHGMDARLIWVDPAPEHWPDEPED